jgi:hypothetical protein
MRETINNNFSDMAEIKGFIAEKNKGCLVVDYINLPEYPGIALNISIIFDREKNSYRLDLQWISLGLDLYGDNLVENYLYEFGSLEKLLNYLEKKYSVKLPQISKAFKFDNNKYPNPIKDKGKKALFEKGWKKLQEDFKKGKFLDSSLELVYSSEAI